MCEYILQRPGRQHLLLPLPSRPSHAGEQTDKTSASHPSSSVAVADAQSKGRRRIPTPDLDAIEDPAERRRQQRLAKTRATAAVARCAGQLSVAGLAPAQCRREMHRRRRKAQGDTSLSRQDCMVACAEWHDIGH